jgi:hypothetical protein
MKKPKEMTARIYYVYADIGFSCFAVLASFHSQRLQCLIRRANVLLLTYTFLSSRRTHSVEMGRLLEDSKILGFSLLRL